MSYLYFHVTDHSFKVSSRVKNHYFCHQELSCKKIPGKNVFSVQTYGVQKFFLYANYFN